MQTWDYIKEATLIKLDLPANQAISEGITNKFSFYANEAITQICSSIKPKYTFAKFVINDDNVRTEVIMPDDFVSFGTDVNFVINEFGGKEEIFDTDFHYMGYNKLMFFTKGTFYISYNARWYTFKVTTKDDAVLDIPEDILDCLPTYIASQCLKIDDEQKAAIYRNEYEMFLSRIDNSHFAHNSTFKISGGW